MFLYYIILAPYSRGCSGQGGVSSAQGSQRLWWLRFSQQCSGSAGSRSWNLAVVPLVVKFYSTTWDIFPVRGPRKPVSSTFPRIFWVLLFHSFILVSLLKLASLFLLLSAKNLNPDRLWIRTLCNIHENGIHQIQGKEVGWNQEESLGL